MAITCGKDCLWLLRCSALASNCPPVSLNGGVSDNQTHVTSLVLPKLDYGNSTLVGLPVSQLNRLQSVLNAAARSIAGIRRSDHVSDAMASFHWLRVPERIRFKIAVLTFLALYRTAPRYLSDNLRRIADIPSRGRLRSAATNRLDIRHSPCSSQDRRMCICVCRPSDLEFTAQWHHQLSVASGVSSEP